MHVNSPMRVTGTTSTTIDYVASNIQENVICNVFDPALSDHNAILVQVPFRKRYKSRGLGRIYSTRNFRSFDAGCRSFNWDSIFCEQDALASFHASLSKLVDRYFPVHPLKDQYRDRKRWLTPGIRISGRNLRFFGILKKFYPINNFVLPLFSRYRKVYRKVVYEAKRLYYSKRLKYSSNEQREAWSIVNEVVSRSNGSHEVQIDSDILNKYFCSVADILTKGLSSTYDPLKFLPTTSGNSFYLSPTTPREIFCTIGSMKKKRASSDDGISVNLLEKLPLSAIQALSDAINISFQSGTFPLCLKLPKILPLYKSGDRSSPSNYRTISILSTSSKLIERLMKDRL
ncbi:uncharacterized protein LOC126736938 [Anthonomus grandis grandis]|uniref:uncharacterized protein LOC126736938 n=1 Tax=Anthonomus grandis grandis TaxID=2921223 RepID=UPI002166096D|nr:uncharacterized protein LOC126736938 [Anthonomus grandis grandis]